MPSNVIKTLTNTVSKALRVYLVGPDGTGLGDNGVVKVAGSTKTIAVEFTRPADTTAYAAKDIVSDSTVATTILTFANAGRYNGAGGYITKVRLVTDDKNNTAQYRLWLYTTNAPTVTADNTPYRLLYADKAIRVGSIDLSALSSEDATNSTSASSMNTDIRMGFQCDSAGTGLYAVLETLTAFTPTSGQKFWIELTIEQN